VGAVNQALDLGLLTYMLDRAAPVYGRTKLQKTIFLSELKLRERDLVGPHFVFIRWDKGPFSQDLWTAYDLLARKGFAYSATYSLTKRGRELSELVAELKRADENREFFKILDATLKYCRPKSGEQLIELVYDMEVTPESSFMKMKIRDIPREEVIIAPPDRTSLVIAHDLEKLILEEIEISEDDIQRALKDDVPEMERALVERAMNAGQRSS
jgi:hypothetical protein